MTAYVASPESKVTNFWSMEEKSSFQNFITAYIFFTSKPPNLQKVFLIFIYLFFAGRWCPFYWGKGLHSPKTAVIERYIYQQITKEDFPGLSLFPVCE